VPGVDVRMSATYFARLARETPTRVWVNNPTHTEVDRALEQGAVGCTLNPAFGGSLVRRAPDEIGPYIARAARETDDDDDAVESIHRWLICEILPRFRPLHDESAGRLGFVSLQGAPEKDTDGAAILADARMARTLGSNCIPKIPATRPGLGAFEALVAEGHPTLITEVFSLDQVVLFSEAYRSVTATTGVHPCFVMAPITGIFGDHLRAIAARDGIAVDPAVLDWAGVVFARAAARLVADRGYPVTLLFGGARTQLDLTGLVGSSNQMTVNWSTFAEVLDADPEVRATIFEEPPSAIVEALLRDFDDFRRALSIGALTVDEFEEFGPVRHFRNAFLAGWAATREAVRAARAERD
jgi:transaldolase